jgi:hypothetical protein
MPANRFYLRRNTAVSIWICSTVTAKRPINLLNATDARGTKRAAVKRVALDVNHKLHGYDALSKVASNPQTLGQTYYFTHTLVIGEICLASA